MTTPLALTPGEPAGIGPDLVVKLAQTRRTNPWVCLADPALITDRAARLGLALKLHEWRPGSAVPPDAGVVPILPLKLPVIPECGTPDRANARALLDALDRAVDGCLAGEFSGLVTGPLQKSTINLGGIPFTGHTDYLAERAGGTPVMMLVAGALRVALVTTHLPLAAVAAAITRERVTTVIEILARDLRERFGFEAPRIAVLGLNPHAGESGHLGREELDVIEPALAALRSARDLHLEGPLPADTAFTGDRLARCDAVLAMYHDQGLPVLKYAGFGQAVNCTLGLPIIRTSVDHGTALDRAGTGDIELGSLVAAIDLAAELAVKQRK
ncbi:MAG: 4-hydroxythreonine-4-phosphate dehydrogenase PdxA [Gammaproteobacteria bacterium]